MVIADTSCCFFYNVLTWQDKKFCQPHVWPPSTFGNCTGLWNWRAWESLLWGKRKEQAPHQATGFEYKRHRKACYTEARSPPCGPPNHPCQPQRGAPQERPCDAKHAGGGSLAGEHLGSIWNRAKTLWVLRQNIPITPQKARMTRLGEGI